MPEVVMYASRLCPYCQRARHLLDSKGVAYRVLDVDGEPELRREMIERAGRYTVPQIWIGAEHVGGCDDLYQLERTGQLDVKLAAMAQGDKTNG